MRPRIAIPLPHSLDREYAERAIPQYEHAVEQMGGEPVRLGMDLSSELKKHELKKIIERCDGILLPGSKADVDPAKFKALPSSHSASADNQRESVDELLLEHAYQSGKPVLGICYGLQSLNVFRGGSLIQHIPDFLPEDLRTRVNHEAGRKIAVAHEVTIESNSRLAEILCGENQLPGPALKQPVNSSHHQSADTIGDGLRIIARCPDDGIIEALEGTDPDHFVLAVQWHPERSVDDDESSRAIFRSFIEAAKTAVKNA
ncbi:MAG: gamma-glutamyl-gamma-aminobutyrate hydrolase family protein [Candidatus Sulfotelmatobacter sp.]